MLSRRVHLLAIWLVALGTVLSAAFIMAANSWMQHPVGYAIEATGRPRLDDIWAVLTNPVFLWGYLHVIVASLVTAAAVMLAVSAWQLRQAARTGPGGEASTERAAIFGFSLRLSLMGRAVLLITHDLDGLDQVDEIIVLDRGTDGRARNGKTSCWRGTGSTARCGTRPGEPGPARAAPGCDIHDG